MKTQDRVDSSLQQKKLIKDRSGQSTIEFIVTFAFSFSMLFIFVKIALNYTNGYMVHYATYMSSRAFLTYDTNEGPGAVYNKAKNKALEEFDKYSIAKILGDETFGTLNIDFNFPGSVQNKLYVGAKTTYEDKFSFTKAAGGAVPMKFTSESFLGKAPVRNVCRKRTCEAITSVKEVTNCNEFATVIDNGC